MSRRSALVFLEREGRIARPHLETLDLREIIENLHRQALDQHVAFRLRAQVFEREHDDDRALDWGRIAGQ